MKPKAEEIAAGAPVREDGESARAYAARLRAWRKTSAENASAESAGAENASAESAGAENASAESAGAKGQSAGSVGLALSDAIARRSGETVQEFTRRLRALARDAEKQEQREREKRERDERFAEAVRHQYATNLKMANKRPRERVRVELPWVPEWAPNAERFIGAITAIRQSALLADTVKALDCVTDYRNGYRLALARGHGLPVWVIQRSDGEKWVTVWFQDMSGPTAPIPEFLR